MGTSTNYNAPTTPEWRAVKREVSVAAATGRPTREVAGRIVRDYIHAGGGPRAIAQREGTLGRSGSAQRVAARVADFLTVVATEGFLPALERAGLTGLESRPVGEVLDALVDTLGGAANTLDDVDARNALSRLRDSLLGQAETLEDIEQILTEHAESESIVNLLIDFYTFYFYEQFCRVFYERLVARVGDDAAESFLEGIVDFLRSALRELHQSVDVRGVDWRGTEGQAIADDLLAQTLTVFGGQ